MPRQRSPNRDRAFEIYREHGGNIENRRIAEILGISEKSVGGWKCKDKWDSKMNGVLQSEEQSTPKEKIAKKHTAVEEKSLVESVMENEALTEKQRLFCLYYVKCFNATKAYQKAYGCSYETAGSNGYAILQNTAIQTEIRRLKQNRLNQALLEPEDIFQKYMDIAFADITDFVQFGQEDVPVMSMFGPVKDEEGNPITKRVNTVKFNSSSEVDGTIITEVKQGKDGASIKLADRMKALDWLTNHMDMTTEEQRARIDKLKADTKKIKGEDINQSQIQEFVSAVKPNIEDIKALFDGENDEKN